MSDFDFTALITDRTKADTDAALALLAKINAGKATEAELEQFNAAMMKGMYNYTDLNRVSAAVYYLDEVLRGYGYQTGVQKIVVPHDDGTASRLPEGYTELEYIQSSGTQYIKTGFTPNQDTRVLYDCERLSAAAAEHFFGVRTGNTTTNAFNFYIYNSGWRSGYNTTTTSVDGPGVARYLIDKNKNITYINGDVLGSATYAKFTSGGEVYLFAMQNVGSGIAYGSHKLYACKVYDNVVLVRDYIPCKNPSGAVGLYDLVTAAFYGNAGTGAFTAGPEVETAQPSAPEMDKYIWYEDDILTDSLMVQYLANISTIRAALKMVGNTPEIPKNIENLTFSSANDIESILQAVQDTINRMVGIVNLGWVMGLADVGLYGGI